eukprot:Pgem_evm1s14826
MLDSIGQSNIKNNSSIKNNDNNNSNSTDELTSKVIVKEEDDCTHTKSSDNYYNDPNYDIRYNNDKSKCHLVEIKSLSYIGIVNNNSNINKSIP